MESDTHSVLPGGKSEWQNVEQTVDRLIAAHQNLMRKDDAEADTAPQHTTIAAPPQRDATAHEPALSAARPFSARWPTIILLAVLWISIALVLSAAFLSIAMLL